MENIVDKFIHENKIRFPDGPLKRFSYGTAGFRDNSDLLDCVIFRSSLIASLRSKCARGAIGVVITASHNPEQDNGVKFVDTQGQMLVPEWEVVAANIANSKFDDMRVIIVDVISRYNLENDFKPIIIIGRDTRPSSDRLVKVITDGLSLLNSQYIDIGYVTTPQLHYIVKCHNSNESYGIATLKGYYEKISSAFKKLMPQISGNKPVLKVDAANGVGAPRVENLMAYVSELVDIQVYNDGTRGKLNYQCGADYVKTNQIAPNGISIGVGDCCVSFDGDADRIVFYHINKNGDFILLDGDKIACLMAMFIQDKLAQLGIKLTISVIQTAYANGNSTNFIQNTLQIPATCVKTGVKYLQRKAHEFDIGIFFEANGHGTVLYSDTTVTSIRAAANNDKLSQNIRESAEDLLNLIDLTNQTTGDAISDMLIVQAILSHKKWTCEEWGQMYVDLPNRQDKVKVSDRTVIITNDDETRCLSPNGLQDAIDQLVSTVPNGRSFVRPSGTEDIVRVYAEAETKELAKKLSVDVAQKVYDIAGGIGNRPS